MVNLVGVLALAHDRVIEGLVLEDLNGGLAVGHLLAGLGYRIQLAHLVLIQW